MSHIFLSYSRADISAARELVRRLRQRGFQIWFDEDALLPGQFWEQEITTALRGASLVIVLLSSKSVSRTGYAQKEIRTALEWMGRLAENRPYLVPLRLDDCAIPEQLAHIHCGSLANEHDFEQLVKALHAFSAPIKSLGQLPPNYAGLQARFDKELDLILPGYGAARVRLGYAEREVVTRLGDPPDLAEYDDCFFWSYQSRGISLRFNASSRLVETIFLYHKGADDFDEFKGATPEGITTNSTRGDVENVFGRPPTVGGEGVIPFWVSYDAHGFGATYNTLDAHDLDAVVHHLDIAPIES